MEQLNKDILSNKARRTVLKWSVPVITSIAIPAHAQTSNNSDTDIPENTVASFDCSVPTTFTETIDSASGLEATFTITPSGSEFSITVEQSNGVVYNPVEVACPARFSNSRALSLSNGSANPIIRIVSGDAGSNTYFVVIE